MEWQSRCRAAVPESESTRFQKSWDNLLVVTKHEELLSAAQTLAGHARLIAAAALHSGDFLHAVPCSVVGTRLDDTSLRFAVALGAIMCAPHSCICGKEVDSYGTHGLVCRKSTGRQMRHNAVNDLVKRALASANIPALLEPKSLSRDDGKRLEGLTVLPVLSHEAIANDAESRKIAKYQSLSQLYSFHPVAVEAVGALDDETTALFRDIGCRIAAVTGEPRSYQFLMQRLSVAVQRGNAACVIGTVPSPLGLDSFFYL